MIEFVIGAVLGVAVGAGVGARRMYTFMIGNIKKYTTLGDGNKKE